jgi:penicillin amidase
MEKLKRDEIRMSAATGEITIRRDENGVPHVRADSLTDLLFGLGWLHACDRPVQLELTRLVAKGLTAEFLKGDPEMVELDRYMRRYNLWGDSKYQAECLRPQTEELVQAYCAGVNHGMGGDKQPLEFRLLKHKQEPWAVADSVAVLKLTGLVDMTETQGWAEKLIVQMIREGVDLERLKELFPYMIEDLNPDYVKLICGLEFEGPIVPETVRWAQLPRNMCSNNWAVAGSRTASGKPILCGDPHLDTSRLPALWQEVALEAGDFYFTGVSMPGIPFPSLGRTRHLAWSATYAYMDVMDYFIEIVKDGKYRRGSEWRDFDVREEIIKVKGGEPLTVRFYETDHGVLEGEPAKDGYYLCFAWSAGRDCGAETLDAMADVLPCTRVEEAMPHFARLDFAAFNWVMADAQGNIGYQMSGRCPARAEGCSGLLPMPGWDESFHWQGYLPREDNPSLYNPPEGFIVTANQDLNRYGRAPVINLCMASYRAERIAELLSASQELDAAYMQRMHYDLYSRQAEAFMHVIRPLLPDTPNGKLLKEWDLRYHSDSREATLFERVYLELVKIVFGQYGVGRQVMDYIMDETILFHDFYGNFDRLLLAEDSLWLGDNSREELIGLACERNLAAQPVPYGSWRKILMKNIFFAGKLPRFLGFDYGPVELIGSRATIPQGQIFKSMGRVATYSPTWKLVADFSEEGIRSVLAGGPSDRRFSKWYKSGIKDWLAANYKRIVPFAAEETRVIEQGEEEKGEL